MIVYMGKFTNTGQCLAVCKSVSDKKVLRVLEARGYEQISKESFEARWQEWRIARGLGNE